MNSKINTLLTTLFLIFCLFTSFSHASTVAANVRNNIPVNILIIGTTDNNLNSSILVRYDPGNTSVLVFPILGNVKLLSNDNKLYYKLNTLFGMYYRNSKGSMKDACSIFKQAVERYTELDIPLYVHMNAKSFNHIVNLLSNLKSPNMPLPKYNNFFNNKNKESAYKNQIYSILNLSKLVGKSKAVFSLAPVIAMPWRYIDTNIKITDVISLISQPKQKVDHNIMFIYAPHDFKLSEKPLYIKEAITKLTSLNNSSNIIKAEVLNAANTKGLAEKTTWTLRQGGIDVQKWGNYGANESGIMIIDRTGNWFNAKKVNDILNKGVVFSRKNPDRYVDVSVILGE